MMKENRLNYKHILAFFVMIIVVITLFWQLFRVIFASPIVFVSQTQEVEIDSEVDYCAFIKEVKNGKIEDVKINSKDVHLDQLGEYKVIYQWKDKENELTLKVVDTVAPKVELKTLEIAQNQDIKAEDLIKKIEDHTQTEVSFEKDYDFSKVGKVEVAIVVKDEGGNQTVEKTNIEVKKDDQAPVIIGNSFSITVHDEIDLKTIVLVKDNYDNQPQLTIEDNGFDKDKVGNYTVKYTAVDFAGNQTEKAIQIAVKDEKAQKDKIVYLTFDDGPSRNTPAVLNILKKYNCKATFFITGMNENYRQYIKLAHDQGHTIGLHTYSHNYSKLYASPAAYFTDLEKVGELAKEYIGYVPKYIRFPGGSSNTVSRKYCQGIMKTLSSQVIEKGYQYYDWNAENGDGYSHMSQSAMLKRATSSSQDQIMILMHDANGKKNTVEILPKVIEYYQKRGYQFKAIDETTPIYHQHINN